MSHDPDLVGETVEPHPIMESGILPPEWTYDPHAADMYARTHARKLSHPPHWVRCDFVRNGVRCVKGSGHEHGTGKNAEHEEPK